MGIFDKGRMPERIENIIDVHSHILPGIDDGSKNLEQSIHMLEIAVQEGIDTIIATPHNMPGKGKASADAIKEAVTALQHEADKLPLPIRVLPGCELFYREEALELLEAEAIPTLNGSLYVLVEFDVMAEKQYIVNGLREIIGLGYTPVVAHVERYASLTEKNFTTIRDLRKMGVLIQVNADTVLGKLGTALRKYAKQMLKEQLVDFIGTDAHSDRTRAPRVQECLPILYKWCSEEYVRALICGNAEKYFDI